MPANLREVHKARYVGRPLPRFEDLRLVRGAGRYTDDLSLPEQAYAAFVRSPHPHARIVHIDARSGLAMPRVLAVLTGADYIADGCGPIPQTPNPSDVIEYQRPAFPNAGGRKVLDAPHLPLAADGVRYVGEPVAVVVAESVEAARDAAESVEVTYERLAAVMDAPAAIAAGAPTIWPDAPDNVAVDAEFGDRDELLRAMAGAHCVVEQVFRNQRIVTAQMEPRAAIAAYDEASGSYTLITGNQGVHIQRHALAGCLRVPPERVRVVCPDVGGAFGSRTYLYPEQAVVAWAARRVGRPVKWTSDRSEAFLTDYQGRDIVIAARLGLRADGRICALELDMLGNAGGHTVSYVPLNNAYRICTGVYDVPCAHVRVRAAVTNTISTGPYRGAGRPEAIFVIERLLDLAARRLGIDRVEIRRRNMVRREQLPYRTAFGLTYDSGDFAGNMRQALEAADWAGAARRRSEARKRGRLLGIGVANYVEAPVGAPHERVEMRVSADGYLELVVGTQSSGQGHETSFAQVAADALGIDPQQVRLIAGDTAKIPSGGGTHSDRSMRIAGQLMVDAATTIVGAGRVVAARLLDSDPEEVAFADGFFQTPKRNRRFSIFDLARAIRDQSDAPNGPTPLAAEAKFTGRLPAHPTGCAVCEVEIDPATGSVKITRYVTVDDAGQPINPLILHGQVHGGIAQGVGQALLEGVEYDSDSGQVLTASFLDYGIPRADVLPFFHVEAAEDPTRGNALRVKGGGESGITPAPAAVINAIVDALSELGIEHLEMPTTPQRIWRAIQTATAAQRTASRRNRMPA